MNQKLYRTFRPLAVLFVSLLITQNLSAKVDSIPIVIKERIDTVITLDLSTKKEKELIIKADEYYTLIIDTIVVFDSDTNEEKVTIVKNYATIREYIDWLLADGKIEKQINQRKVLSKDTIHVFDSDTYVETVSVMSRVDECFYLQWGNYCFSTLHKLSLRMASQLLIKPISIVGPIYGAPCGKIEDFNFTVIVDAPEMEPKAFNLTHDNRALPYDKVSKMFVKGANIYIVHAMVNGDYKVPPVKFTVGD